MNAGSVRARANSAPLAKRSAGALDNAHCTAASTLPGTASRTRGIGCGVTDTTLAMIACTVFPVWGGSPTSISYTTAPREYRSLRAVSSRSPVACSGLMYSGVPSERPVSVSRVPPAALTASAIPKSATSASPW